MKDWTDRIVAPLPDGPIQPGPIPTFSVVIAAYQAAGFIANAVESALGQTAPPHEIIVSDDGSTDDLEGALRPYQERTVLIRREHLGEGSARNAGLQAASGEFVAPLDADDTWLPERLDALGQLARVRPDLDILATDGYLESGGRIVARIHRDCAPFITEGQRAGILKSNFLLPHPAIRRERLLALGGFDESMLNAADWDSWIRLILDGARAGLVDEPLQQYRLREGSLSSNLADLIRWSVIALEKANGNASLTAEERQILTKSLSSHRRSVVLFDAQTGLMSAASGARRRALAIAFGDGFGFGTRVRAAAAALAPHRAGRFLNERARQRPYQQRCPGATLHA